METGSRITARLKRVPRFQEAPPDPQGQPGGAPVGEPGKTRARRIGGRQERLAQPHPRRPRDGRTQPGSWRAPSQEGPPPAGGAEGRGLDLPAVLGLPVRAQRDLQSVRGGSAGGGRWRIRRRGGPTRWPGQRRRRGGRQAGERRNKGETRCTPIEGGRGQREGPGWGRRLEGGEEAGGGGGARARGGRSGHRRDFRP